MKNNNKAASAIIVTTIIVFIMLVLTGIVALMVFSKNDELVPMKYEREGSSDKILGYSTQGIPFKFELRDFAYNEKKNIIEITATVYNTSDIESIDVYILTGDGNSGVYITNDTYSELGVRAKQSKNIYYKIQAYDGNILDIQKFNFDIQVSCYGDLEGGNSYYNYLDIENGTITWNKDGTLKEVYTADTVERSSFENIEIHSQIK